MDTEHGGGVRSALYAYHRGQIERDLERTSSARRHLAEALRINPYFSPLLAPLAKQALTALGDPPAVAPGEEPDDSSEQATPEQPQPQPQPQRAPAPAPRPSGSR
jgi:hypothetical protein